MLGSVFLKSLRDYRKSFIWWAIGLSAFLIYVLSLYRTVVASVKMEVLKAMPEAVMAFFGAQGMDITQPAGYLRMYVFSILVPLMFLVLAVGAGSGAIAGEEENGTLDLLLANPVPRRRVLLEKFAAFAAYTGALAVVAWASLVIGARAAGMEIAAGNLAAGVASILLLSLCFGTLALALGAASGSRGLGTGAALALGIAGYLIHTMSTIVEAMEPYRYLSPWYYYIGADPARSGLNPVHAGVLVALTLAFLAFGLYTFERRDLSA